ncbi:hypothetical protein GCM10022223_43060 [Kineosporia mesophila]|uniref:PIN like domain-containing protein n=1 Tax=Kineosporia mesophila TaxID=566012 RepID=A0ABP6ZY93_9ACTN|nr:PIN-like domain-containing protein [Kineosporia mesophila]MCD5353257.1 PIN-like domain-containing protein [Kineosporia mesophila]
MSDTAVNVDMYRDYPGYRIIDRSEIDQALTKALVVVDTNLLLNLYRYAEGTCDDLLGVLGSLGDRLWIPPQVMREFWRGRLSVLTGRGSATDAVIATLEKQQRAGADAINQWVKSIAVDPDEAVRLRKVLASAHDEVAKTVLMHAPPQAVNPSVTDPVLQRLETLLVGKVGPIPDAGAWQKAIAEGKARSKNKIPPGFRDIAKEESDLEEGPAGDYLVWSQSMAEAKRRGLDLILVTGDEKDDWWWKHRNQFLGPRPELVREFDQLCGHRFFMLRPVQFLNRGSVLKAPVRHSSVVDAARVSQETAQEVWPEAAVTALIEQLDDEGYPQADVIRQAAANGGSVSREEIFEICNFDSDRMLRGFTRPCSRITSYLKNSGVLPREVQPCLRPEFDKEGIAKAFLIPPEMVDVLAGEEGA